MIRSFSALIRGATPACPMRFTVQVIPHWKSRSSACGGGPGRRVIRGGPAAVPFFVTGDSPGPFGGAGRPSRGRAEPERRRVPPRPKPPWRSLQPASPGSRASGPERPPAGVLGPRRASNGRWSPAAGTPSGSANSGALQLPGTWGPWGTSPTGRRSCSMCPWRMSCSPAARSERKEHQSPSICCAFCDYSRRPATEPPTKNARLRRFRSSILEHCSKSG